MGLHSSTPPNFAILANFGQKIAKNRRNLQFWAFFLYNNAISNNFFFAISKIKIFGGKSLWNSKSQSQKIMQIFGFSLKFDFFCSNSARLTFWSFLSNSVKLRSKQVSSWKLQPKWTPTPWTKNFGRKRWSRWLMPTRVWWNLLAKLETKRRGKLISFLYSIYFKKKYF